MRRTIALMVACALAAALAAGLGARAEEHVCDRRLSRDVRRVLREVLAPNVADREELPATCPLSPSIDRFLRQEVAKEPLAQGRWRCRHCGKQFHGEHYLDKHMALRHPQLELQGANASCLADWHAVLHAQHLVAFFEGVEGWAADPLHCRQADAMQLQAACLHLASQCAPGSTGRLHTLLAGHLCKAHTCDKRRKRSHLQAVAKVHVRRRGGRRILAAAALVVLATFWLLLWLVHSNGGSDSALYRRLAAGRRRLAVAAKEQRLLLPGALSDLAGSLWGHKPHSL